MAQQLAEAQVARLLAALGVLVFAGLLPVPYIDYAAAALVAGVGLLIVVARPRGNRLLGGGLVALGVVLGLAAYKQPVSPGILNALTVLVAAVLLGSAWLKHQGKW